MKSCEKRNYSLRRDYRRKSQEAPGSARQASRLTSFFLRVGMELQHSLSTKQCYLFLQKKKKKKKKNGGMAESYISRLQTIQNLLPKSESCF